MRSYLGFLLVTIISFTLGCSEDELKEQKENTKEVIDFVMIEIWYPGSLDPVTVEYTDDDGDGEFVSDTPLLTLSDATTLQVVFTTYDAVESTSIYDEMDDHIFCFDPTNNIMTVTFLDEDSNELPFGWNTEWVTGAPGTGQLTMTLRHQPGTKNGECPGEGEVIDFQITQAVKIE